MQRGFSKSRDSQSNGGGMSMAFPTFSPNQRLRVLHRLERRDGPGCFYCGKTFKLLARLTLDHYKPTCMGGSSDLENLVLSCRNCNNEKSAFDINKVPHWRLTGRLEDRECCTCGWPVMHQFKKKTCLDCRAMYRDRAKRQKLALSRKQV